MARHLRRHCQQPVQLGGRERLGLRVLRAPRQAHAARLRSHWVCLAVIHINQLLSLMLGLKAHCSRECALIRTSARLTCAIVMALLLIADCAGVRVASVALLQSSLSLASGSSQSS